MPRTRIDLNQIKPGSPNQFITTDFTGDQVNWTTVDITVPNSKLGTLSRDSNNKLVNSNPTNFKLIGGFYYPRKAVNPDWFSEMVRTDIPLADRLSWEDIETDLDQLSTNNINTLRIVIQYNLTTFGTSPLVDTNLNIDPNKEAVLIGFLDRCRAREICVFTQTNFGFEGALSAADLTEIQDYINSTNDIDLEARRFNDHIDWLTNIITSYSDVIIVNKTFNEPDGFGTWSNFDDAVLILKFLSKIKKRFIEGYPNIPYIVNAVTDVNFNCRFPEAPEGIQSIYEVSDWAVFNSYYWADSGFFEFTHYRRQFERMILNNFDNKPLLLTEFGWPSNYDGQGVGEESFIPENGQFDRPIGNNTLMPHTQENQDRGIKEGVFFSEQNSAVGAMCWSLYQHENRNNDPNFFQDSFGLINSNGTLTTAFKQLKRAFTSKFDDDGIAPFSITSGVAFGGAHINGDQGFNVNDTPAGVYIPIAGGYRSPVLNLKTPFYLSSRVLQTTQPSDNGVSLGINFVNNGSFFVQFEDFSNRWRLFLDNTEVAATLDVGSDFGLVEKKLTFSLATRFLEFYVDGVKQDFFDISDNITPYELQLNQIWYQADMELTCNASTADVKLIEVFYEETI